MAAPPPPSGPASTAKSGPGCLVIAVLLPIVVILGLVIGAALSDKDDPDGKKSANLAEGTLDGTTWRVDAERDVEGAICIFLYADDEQLTGACDPTPQDATFGDQTVVFGIAPAPVDLGLGDAQRRRGRRHHHAGRRTASPAASTSRWSTATSTPGRWSRSRGRFALRCGRGLAR